MTEQLTRTSLLSLKNKEVHKYKTHTDKEIINRNTVLPLYLHDRPILYKVHKLRLAYGLTCCYEYNGRIRFWAASLLKRLVAKRCPENCQYFQQQRKLGGLTQTRKDTVTSIFTLVCRMLPLLSLGTQNS